MRVQKMFVVAAAVTALVLGMFMPLNVSAQDKVYELTFAWNDIWGPKFRASQVYRPCGEMQRMVHERTNGRVKLKIPAETQTGKLFLLRGKGVTPVRGGSVGDLLIRVVVETPVKLNSKHRELLRELDTSLKNHGKHSPQHHTWLDGVKNFFDSMKF